MHIARKKGYFSKVEGNKLIVSNSTGVNVQCTVDSLDKLPSDLKPASLFTPTRGNITLFYSRHSPHSNFYQCKFIEDRKEFNCVEKYPVYHNALSVGDNKLANKVYYCEDPAQIKQMGKNITLDLDIKKEHMKKGMVLKYTQNPECMDSLKDAVVCS